MKQKKYYTQIEVDEYVRELLTKSEIALSKQAERLEQERQENERLSALVEEYKKKEKAISRLLILSERKAKFLETNTRSRCAMEIERLARLAEKWDSFFEHLGSTYSPKDKQKLDEFKSEISTAIDNMLEMESLFGDKPLTEAEKAHEEEINRLGVIKDKHQSEIDQRFNKLVSEFNMKIGDNATRKRGRPKKDASSNVKDIERALEKDKAKDKGIYPPVSDSGFDFEEALNPTDSLEDIMRDLLGSDFDDIDAGWYF